MVDIIKQNSLKKLDDQEKAFLINKAETLYKSLGINAPEKSKYLDVYIYPDSNLGVYGKYNEGLDDSKASIYIMDDESDKKTISTLSLSNNALFPGMKEDVQIPIISNSMLKSYSKQITISVNLSNYQGDNSTKTTNTLLSFKPFFVSGIIPWIIVFILFIFSIIIVDVIYRVKNKQNNP